ncbi:MAG: right-handed parallel beta-helix repeat-containing protein [Thermomicrobiales bacterium]|nr:right-handed parallel beta-helix repeat-containing protein [Thermomicrobiales bacterium]
MRRFIYVVVATLLLTACAGGSDATSTPEPVSEATAAPTATATTAPSPTATATQAATPTATASPTVGPPTATAGPTATPAPPLTELQCGAEIATSVTLANDMACDPIAIVVTGDNLVLDLGGRTITGPGPGSRTWPMPRFDIAGVIVRGSGVTVRNGTVSSSGIGVLVDGGSAARIEQVQTLGNYYGIYLYEGGGSTIDGNVVRDNVYGLHLQQTTGNTLTNNNLSKQTHHSPGGYGLYLYSSSGNRIEGNTIQENLNWGLWFSDSNDNVIVRNNIIGNDPQVSDDSGGNIYFDEATREGNFWSDYAGADSNGDGIGEDPYTIGGPGRLTDPYPFMAQDGWQGRTTATLGVTEAAPPSESPPRAYVQLENGDIAAIDSASGTLIGSWSVGAAPPSMATSFDGTRLYAIGGDGEAANVLAIDTSSGQVVERWEIPGAQVVAAMYDGARVLASSQQGLTEIVLETGELRPQHDGADAIAITPSWKHNLATVTAADGEVSVVYLPNQHAPYSFALSGAPVQVVDNRPGTRLFALVDGEADVLVVDTEQFAITDRIPLGDIDPAHARMAPSPDGTLLYVLDTEHGRVVAIDLGTKKIVADAEIDAGLGVDISISADGDWIAVAVADGGSSRVAIYDHSLALYHAVMLGRVPVAIVSPR